MTRTIATLSVIAALFALALEPVSAQVVVKCNPQQMQECFDAAVKACRFHNDVGSGDTTRRRKCEAYQNAACRLERFKCLAH